MTDSAEPDRPETPQPGYDVRQLRHALLVAVRTIHTWHQIHMGEADAEAWLLYSSSSPEMKVILAALAALAVSPEDVHA